MALIIYKCNPIYDTEGMGLPVTKNIFGCLQRKGFQIYFSRRKDMAVAEIRNAYGGIYESAYASSQKEAVKQEESREPRRTEETGKVSNGEYLKSIQKQVPYVKLETGFALSMKKDKRAGVEKGSKDRRKVHKRTDLCNQRHCGRGEL